jgi:hypothetical protein
MSAWAYNTPLEAGFRALFVLAAAGGRSLDTDRLLQLDYATVHAETVGGPENLHPETPSQRDELLVRRSLVQRGLALMRSRELVERRFEPHGIAYRATEAGQHVVEEFASEYAERLRRAAEWAVSALGDLNEEELRAVLRDG